ncbi:MAG: hypothetical protein AAFP02_23465, partial [Bacteroidota bacterium]
MKHLALLFFPILFACASAPQTSPQTADSSPSPSFGDPEGFREAYQIRAPIYYSDDLGLTWQALADNLPAEAQVSFMTWMGDRMLVATDNLGLFISDERLANWQAIGTALPSPKLNALWIEGNDIYVGVYREGIFTSADIGQSWQSLQHNLPEKKVQALRIFDDKLVAGTDIGIYQFDKKLSKWESLYEGLQVLSLEAL